MANLSFISATRLGDLLRATRDDGDMLIRILNEKQLALGVDPLNPSYVIDLSDESVRPWADGAPRPADGTAAAATPQRRSRQSGRYELTLKGETVECRSLWEALGEGLKRLERLKPGTLERLAQVKGRSKRIVARNASELFTKPESVEKFAEPLQEGWWFGKNNSAEETRAWLRRGAEIAGLKWGTDISTSF